MASFHLHCEKLKPGSPQHSCALELQAAIGAGVEDTRDFWKGVVALDVCVVKMQRAEDKRAVEIMQKVAEQEVCPLLQTIAHTTTRSISFWQQHSGVHALTLCSCLTGFAS